MKRSIFLDLLKIVVRNEEQLRKILGVFDDQLKTVIFEDLREIIFTLNDSNFIDILLKTLLINTREPLVQN